MQQIEYTWLPFFEELLNVVCNKYDKYSLVKQAHNIFSTTLNDQEVKGQQVPLEEIDPLTFIAMFNRGNTKENRISYCEQAKEIFEIDASVPLDFSGIPVFNNQKTWFFNYKYSREENIIDDLWDFARQVNNKIEMTSEIFNKILSFPQIGLSKLSQFLFICNPDKYYPADTNSIQLIYEQAKREDSFDFYSKYVADIKSSQYSNLKPYEYSKLAEQNRNKKKQESIEDLRNSLLQYGSELGASTNETGQYTALKLNKNIAEVHRIGKRNNKFRMVINFEDLDEIYQVNVKRVPDSYGWSNLNGEFWIDSKETFEQAKQLLENVINGADYKANYYWLNLDPSDIKGLNTGDVFEYNLLTPQGKERPLFNQLSSTDKILGYIISPQKQVKLALEFENISEDKAIFKIKSFAKYPVSFDSLMNVERLKNSELAKNQKYGKCLLQLTKNEFDIIDKLMRGDKTMVKDEQKAPLNQILLGPPGTGKTYETRKIIRNILQKQVDDLNNQHNTNDDLKLKEVVEGLTWYDVIALTMYRNGKDKKHKVKEISEFPELKVYYELKNCKNLKATLWGQLQIHTGLDSKTVNYSEDRRSEPFIFNKTENSEWILTEAGKKYVKEELADALQLLKGDKQHKLEDFYKFITFHQSYSYEEFVEGLKPEVNEETGNITYNIENGIFKDICKEARRDLDKGLKYVLVIDEINRGNISKIFGELITLIEDTKRIKLNPKEDDEGLEVTLPYSKQLFGVPENLYIVGTMNTADRSIALLDLALRRRFDFIPKYPDSSKIKDGKGISEVNGINLESFLDAINERIEVLYDKDHTIGHSYLMGINDYSDFLKAFNNKIFPLLQEYFYNDYDKIAKVLNQNDFEENETAIIHKTEVMGIPKYSINPLLETNSFAPAAFERTCLIND